MKRTSLLIVVVALASALMVSGNTHASIIPGSGVGPIYGNSVTCYSLPKQTPCPTATPNTIPEIFPVKSMSVSGAIAGPYGVDNYSIGIVSQVGCFSLTEPILVSALGNHGEAVFRQVSPPLVGGNPYQANVVVGPDGTATLAMEVWSSQVGPAGLVVKAVWPEEGVERLQSVIAPSATTPLPATATAVPTAVPPTATGTPPATATAGPTVTPVPTETTTPVPLTVSSCYNQKTSAIDIRTAPGASCTLALSFNNGPVLNAGYNQGPFVMPPSGVGEDVFTAPPGATVGTAVTTCTLDGQTASDTLNLAIPTPTPLPSPTAPH